MLQLPIVHIDQLCKELDITRDWVNRRWINSDNPPPYFRDGDAVFFELEELKAWAKRRSYESGSTDMQGDPTD